jgi:hypothetical protein
VEVKLSAANKAEGTPSGMTDRTYRIWWLSSWLLLAGLVHLAQAAEMVAAEYFIGGDPGAGNGTALVLSDSNMLSTGFGQVSLTLSGRPPGTYNVGIRVRDDQGRWSNPALRRFTIASGAYQLAGGLDRSGPASQGTNDSSVLAIGAFAGGINAEYFVGNDPGAGKGTALALTGTSALATGFQQASLSLSGRQGRPPGNYSVGIRVRDDQGRWSNPLFRRFTLQPAALLVDLPVAGAEATGPIPASAARWSLALGSNISDSKILDLAGHRLTYLRAPGETDTVFLQRIRDALDAELYVTTRFTVGPLSAGAFTLTAKQSGPHTDFPVSSTSFLVDRLADGTIGGTGMAIVAAEYFWDLDPGAGRGKTIPVSLAGSQAGFGSQAISLEGLSGGNHRMGVRFKNGAGRWSNPLFRGITSFSLFGAPDTVPPLLSLNGADPLSISQGTSFIDPGAGAVDVTDGNLNAKVVVSIGIDPTKPGVQTMEYAVVDSAGNISRLRREVQVQPADPNQDGDGDGLPDLWEEAYFAGRNVSPASDPDGDGTNNLMEYLAGTNPLDRASIFRPFGSLSGTVYTLPIPTVAGRSYKIWATRDLASWHFRQTLTGDGTVKNFTLDESSITSGPLYAPSQAASWFFRVEVSLP